MEFTITKEQVLETVRTGTDVTNRYLKEILPEAFKAELEVGKWYKNTANGFEKSIACVVEIRDGYTDEFKGYGFGKAGVWVGLDHKGFFASYDWTPATDKEVEEALLSEAKKRGFINGNYKCLCIPENTHEVQTGAFFFENGGLWQGIPGDNVNQIFKRGKWAEILPEEKTVITKEKVLKILAKKYNTTPENIEIQ